LEIETQKKAKQRTTLSKAFFLVIPRRKLELKKRSTLLKQQRGTAGGVCLNTAAGAAIQPRQRQSSKIENWL
jgi:hypothetical protein